MLDCPPNFENVDWEDLTYRDISTLYREINEKDVFSLCHDLAGAFVGLSYWYIKHGEDTKVVEFDGVPYVERKIPHFHILLHFRQKITKSGVVNAVSQMLGVPAPRVDVEEVKSVVGALRYLVHYGETDKFEYDPTKVISNDLDRFNEALSVDIGKKSITFKELSLRVECATSLADFGETISLEDFRKYYSVIRSLFILYKNVDIAKISNFECSLRGGTSKKPQLGA